MAARQGFVVSNIAPAPSEPSPNAVQTKITVEIRVSWPARMNNEPVVERMLMASLAQAYIELKKRTEPHA